MNIDQDYVLELKNISKYFPGVQALDNVNFQLKRGEIHALVGENGAGKSTLIKIICGVYPKDSGEIYLNGKNIKITDVHSARKFGISFVPQEIELMNFLNVSENIYVGKYPSKFGFIKWLELNKQTDELKKLFGGTIAGLNNFTLAEELTIANKQIIEILKVLALDMQILCLDEPTSSLTKDETERLFKLLIELKNKDISIIYVSHRLEEIFNIADRVTVFKDGKYIMTKDISNITIPEVVNSMVGRELNMLVKMDRSKNISDEIVLEVENLSNKDKFKNISFKLKKGEILGWFGLIGSGRSEVVESLFGIEKFNGTVKIFGKEVNIDSPKKAIKEKIGLAPEDRHGQGLVLILDVNNNINLPVFEKISTFGFVDNNKAKKNSLKIVKDLNIKTPSIYTIVDSLSGGNKQKVSIGKWINADSQILIFDEPTKGIDVGSKNEIYKLIRELANAGKSIIFISSELPEIVNLSDRILVFRDGKITKELINNEKVTEHDVFKYAISNEMN